MSSHPQPYVWPQRKPVYDLEIRRRILKHLSRSTDNLRQAREHLLSVYLVSEDDEDFAEQVRSRYEQVWRKVSENTVAVTSYARDLGYVVAVFNFDVELSPESVSISDYRRYH